MPQLRENWRPSLCLLMADCQLALCSFRSAKSHNAFWHGKGQNTWWRARRQLGSWLRSCIMEWKRWTNGKRERKTWEKYHRAMWVEGVVFGMSQGAATKRWTIAGDTAGAWTTDSQWVCFLRKTYFSGGAPLFHCLISLYLGSKLKSKQCSSCF